MASHLSSRSLGLLAALGALAVACSSSTPSRGYAEEQSNAPNTPLAPPDTGGALGGGGPSSPGEDPSCAAQVKTAERAQVDIVVVIDTSGSMGEETAQVQQNINAFAQAIGGSGLDYRVVMIAEKPPNLPFPLPVPRGICVPPPLGGASCANNPPLFHHLNEEVSSRDSLELLLDKLSSYEPWLRPTAYKVFIEVTDDDSSLPYTDFDAQLLARSPTHFGTPDARRYIFNAICGWKRATAPLSPTKCGSAVNIGEQYQHLALLTGGTIESVCETSYASVFGNIAKGLVTRLGCEFAVPQPEAGASVDPSKVVVRYTPAGGAAAPLTQVTDPSKCDAVGDGWYYDDPASPKKIVFCPTTCATVGADTSGSVEIAVGCKAPPPK